MSVIIETEGLKFVCRTQMEVYRAKTLLTKEAGTVEWLKAEVQAGTVLYDVGANIGCYTLLAASLGAQVVAFEPHTINAASLLRNIAENGLGERVQVVTQPLSHCEKWGDFNYHSLSPGSSGSQFGHTTSETGQSFSPEATERKHSLSLDTFVRAHCLVSGQYPTLLKLDVDGNEMDILHGGEALFRRTPPLSVQVEVRPSTAGDVWALLQHKGYPNVERNDTALGKTALMNGADSATVPHNLVFRRDKGG